LVPCHESRQLRNINSFPARQVETVEVETFLLSSQGSRIVSMESHPSCIHPWSVLLTFKFSKSNKEVRPGSIEALCYAPLCCYRNIKRCTLSFSRFAPHHGRLFRPLSPIVISVTTIRCHDVALPSIPATIFATQRSRELTLLSSVLSTPDTDWVN
jgi:hypothetical protein